MKKISIIIILFIFSFQIINRSTANSEKLEYKVKVDETKLYKFTKRINSTIEITKIEVYVNFVAMDKESINLSYNGYYVEGKKCLEDSIIAVCTFGWFDYQFNDSTGASYPIIGIFITKTGNLSTWENYIQNNDSNYKIEENQIVYNSYYGGGLIYTENTSYTVQMDSGWLVTQENQIIIKETNTTFFYSFEENVTKPSSTLNSISSSTLTPTSPIALYVIITGLSSLYLSKKIKR